MAARKLTPHQQAEKELTAFALSLPETDLVQGWKTTRYLRVRKKGFCVFGAQRHVMDKDENELSMIVKLPVAAEMVQELYFVTPSEGWYRQHDWVIAHFGPEDSPLEEMETLRAWVVQSWRAVAPKKLARMVAS